MAAPTSRSKSLDVVYQGIIEELQATNKKLEEENEHSRSYLKDLYAQIAEAASAELTLKSQIRALKKARKEDKFQCKTLTSQKEELEKGCKILESANASLHASLLAKKKEVEDEIYELSSIVKESQSRLEASLLKVQHLEERAAFFETQLFESRKKIEEEEKAKAEYIATITKLNQKLEEEMSQRQSDRAFFEIEMGSKKREIEACQQEMAVLRVASFEKRDEVRAVEAVLRERNETLGKRESEMERLRLALNKSDKELERYKGKVTKLEKELSQYKQASESHAYRRSYWIYPQETTWRPPKPFSPAKTGKTLASSSKSAPK